MGVVIDSGYLAPALKEAGVFWCQNHREQYYSP